jgi:hypothetical protein
MQKGGHKTWELRRPLTDFGAQDEFQFKFVIDGTYWVEPPPDAANRKPTSLANKSFNLVLRIARPS